jgi:hypothetical protein
MIELPSSKINATRVNPKKLILFSKPKVGKTEMISGLDDCLLIDLEDGSEFVSAMKTNICVKTSHFQNKGRKCKSWEIYLQIRCYRYCYRFRRSRFIVS